MQITYPRAHYSSIETWMKSPAPPNVSSPPDRLYTRFSSTSTVSKVDWPKRPRWSWRFLLRSSFLDRCCSSAYRLRAKHKPAYQSTHAIDSLPPLTSLGDRTVIAYQGNQWLHSRYIVDCLQCQLSARRTRSLAYQKWWISSMACGCICLVYRQIENRGLGHIGPSWLSVVAQSRKSEHTMQRARLFRGLWQSWPIDRHYRDHGRT